MKKFHLAFLLTVSYICTLFAQGDSAAIYPLLRESYQWRKKDLARAVKILDSAESLVNERTAVKWRARLICARADIFGMLGDRKKAYEYYEKAIAMSPDRKFTGDIYAGKAGSHLQEGDFESAIKSLHHSIEAYEQAGVIEEKWNVKNDLAICYAQTGNTNEAIKYFREVYRNQIATRADPLKIADTYINIGVVFDMINQLDSVKVAYQKAQDILIPLGNTSSLAMLLNNLGTVYFKTKEYETGKKYFRKALMIELATGDLNNAALMLNNMADVLRGSGKVEEGLGYALRAYHISDSIGNLQQKISSMGCLSLLYAKKNDFKNAWYYSSSCARLNDSVNGLEKAKNIAEMESKYESEKKQKEIELLSKDNQLHQAQMAQEKNLRYFLLGGAVLVLIIALMLFAGLRAKNRANKELDLKNHKIEQAYKLIEEKQKEILDSIHYAKRIQESFLPNQKTLGKKLSNIRKTGA